MKETFSITLNGHKHACPPGTTVAALVADLRARLGLGPDTPIVAELNGTIIPEPEHQSAALSQGDCVELVHFVGGG